MANASDEPAVRGQAAERQAEAFLNQHGLRTLARNHRSPRGELDLVMSDEDGECTTVVFVEVRQRQHSHGAAMDSIDLRKQRRLIRAAEDFLLHHPHCAEHACRFDVITLTGADQLPRWIPAAFAADF